MTDQAAAPAVQQPKQSILARFAQEAGLDAGRTYDVLKNTILRDASDAELQAFLAVCVQYRLNPFLKQIHAFKGKGGGIVPIVGIDGWIAIVNSNDVFLGEEFDYGPPMEEGAHKGKPEWIQCTMWRKDRQHPTRIREYFRECYRNTDPWNQTGARMLRHRAYIQCGRVAFGLSGIYDPDEGDQIINGDVREVHSDATIAALNRRMDAQLAAPQQATALAQAMPEVAEAVPVEKGVESVSTTEMPGANAEGEITPEQLRADMRAAKTIDELDLCGDLIQYTPKADQTDLSNLYGERRKALTGR